MPPFLWPDYEEYMIYLEIHLAQWFQTFYLTMYLKEIKTAIEVCPAYFSTLLAIPFVETFGQHLFYEEERVLPSNAKESYRTFFSQGHF